MTFGANFKRPSSLLKSNWSGYFCNLWLLFIPISGHTEAGELNNTYSSWITSELYSRFFYLGKRNWNFLKYKLNTHASSTNKLKQWYRYEHWLPPPTRQQIRYKQHQQQLLHNIKNHSHSFRISHKQPLLQQHKKTLKMQLPTFWLFLDLLSMY